MSRSFTVRENKQQLKEAQEEESKISFPVTKLFLSAYNQISFLPTFWYKSLLLLLFLLLLLLLLCHHSYVKTLICIVIITVIILN
jgi:hypothetical protein